MSFYYVHVMYQGERMGSPHGIPCRTESEASSLVDEYKRRGCQAWLTTSKAKEK